LGLLPLSSALTTGSRQDKPETRTANVQVNSGSDRRRNNTRNSSTSANSPHRYVGNNRQQQNQQRNQQSQTGPGRYDYFPGGGHHVGFQNRSFYNQNQQRGGYNDQYHYDRRPFVQPFDGYGDRRFHGGLGFRDGRIGTPNR
jgi:hypothetical protein